MNMITPAMIRAMAQAKTDDTHNIQSINRTITLLGGLLNAALIAGYVAIITLMAV